MTERRFALTVRDDQLIKLKVLGLDGKVKAEGQVSIRRVRRGVSKVSFALPDGVIASAQNTKARLTGIQDRGQG